MLILNIKASTARGPGASGSGIKSQRLPQPEAGVPGCGTRSQSAPLTSLYVSRLGDLGASRRTIVRAPRSSIPTRQSRSRPEWRYCIILLAIMVGPRAVQPTSSASSGARDESWSIKLARSTRGAAHGHTLGPQLQWHRPLALRWLRHRQPSCACPRGAAGRREPCCSTRCSAGGGRFGAAQHGFLGRDFGDLQCRERRNPRLLPVVDCMWRARERRRLPGLLFGLVSARLLRQTGGGDRSRLSPRNRRGYAISPLWVLFAAFVAWSAITVAEHSHLFCVFACPRRGR